MASVLLPMVHQDPSSCQGACRCDSPQPPAVAMRRPASHRGGHCMSSRPPREHGQLVVSAQPGQSSEPVCAAQRGVLCAIFTGL